MTEPSNYLDAMPERELVRSLEFAMAYLRGMYDGHQGLYGKISDELWDRIRCSVMSMSNIRMEKIRDLAYERYLANGGLFK